MIRRSTDKKEAILNYFENNKVHPTAQDIFLHMKELFPSISLATIYRNIQVLLDQNMIFKLETGDTFIHYDLVCEEHGHFICDVCNHIYDFDLPKENLNLIGFEVKRIDYQVTGTCKNCKEKMEGIENGI